MKNTLNPGWYPIAFGLTAFSGLITYQAWGANNEPTGTLPGAEFIANNTSSYMIIGVPLLCLLSGFLFKKYSGNKAPGKSEKFAKLIMSVGLFL